MPLEARSPWGAGLLTGRGPSGLLFGLMHEDWRIELDAFPDSGRVFCIASAGCTALALASHGYEVTAVDVNPAQVSYVRRRLAGARPEAGRIDRLLAISRRFLPALGWTRTRLRSFLGLSDPAEQSRFWNERLDTRRWRVGLAVLLHPLALGRAYRAAFLSAVPRPFAPILRRRLARAWATHANDANPYAWRLLLGEDPPGWRAPEAGAGTLELVCAEAAEYLEGCPPASFDALTLSNILDGAPQAYGARLLAAARRAGRRECPIVVRSFAQPDHEDADRWAARDRALLWGSLRIL